MGRRRSVSPLRRLAAEVAGGARAEAVFGRPVAQGDLVVVPVARTRLAFGGGGGRNRRRGEAGEGGGGAAVVRPAGYIELRDGRARYRRIRGTADAVALVSVLVAAVLAWRAMRAQGGAPTAP